MVGKTPAGLRQKSASAFGGFIPKNAAGVIFEPFVSNGMLTYVNPNNQVETALAQGGLFYFGSEQTVKVHEIRALAALGNISAVVGDLQDIKSAKFTVGGATPAIDLTALAVIPKDKVIVTSPAGVETYTVKTVISATELELEEIVTDRALAVGDVFTITSADGVTTRYTHTLAGVDTLDVDTSTIHDVPVGTPAASRIVFFPPVILLPTQVLKVSTAAANAAGWLDIYVVKGDWI